MRLSRLVEKMELLVSSNLKTWNLHKEQFKMDTLLRNYVLFWIMLFNIMKVIL